MNFEILFLVFVVGIMVISQILKQLARTSGSGEDGQKPVSGWRKALANIVEEIRREMEKGKGPPPAPEDAPRSRETWWEDLMDQDSSARQEAPEAPEAPAASAAGKEKMPHQSREGWGRPDSGGDFSRPWGRQPRPGPVAKPKSPAMVAEKRSPMSRSDLRNAVIWSEILGKPVALRDMDR